MARALRKIVGIGLLAGLAYAAWRWWDAQRQSAGTDWEPQPFPYPPAPKAPSYDITEEITPDD
jgi:hypothetical protein